VFRFLDVVREVSTKPKEGEDGQNDDNQADDVDDPVHFPLQLLRSQENIASRQKVPMASNGRELLRSSRSTLGLMGE
jgi:hypothetical protein